HSGSLFWVRDGALLAQRLNLRTLELKGQPVPVAQDVGLESVIGLAHASVSPAGVLSYDAVGREPTQLTWFDRSGKVLGTVGGPGSDHSPRISPDGKFVLVARVDDSSASSDIWWIDLSRNAAGRATAVPSGRGFLGPVWSPDGKEV